MEKKFEDELCQLIYDMVLKAQGKKQLKAMDIVKAVQKTNPECKKPKIKMALKWLVDNGHLVYTYFGGSFIEIPHEEGAAKKI